MKKRVVMVALAGVMAASAAGVFAGCNGASANTYEWLIARDDNAESSNAENPVINYWLEQTGIDVEFYDPQSGPEAWNQQLIDGEYSDIVDLGLNRTESLPVLAEEGVVWDIAPYIEECMPNLNAILNSSEWADIRRSISYGDAIYTIPIIEETVGTWGGYMYRHDMVTAVRGEDFTWPSGEEEPTTIADWEYIMEAVLDYYKQNNIVGAYPMYLAPEGYYQIGTILAGYGIGGNEYLDGNTVKFGIYEDAFYDYLETVRSWVQKGYISPDFATADYVFPSIDNNSVLANRLGVFFGYTNQLGGQLEGTISGAEGVDIRPLANPVVEEGRDPIGLVSPDNVTRALPTTGYAITTACNEDELKTILKAMDWWFSEEGSRTRTMGLSSAQGAADVEDYIEDGITNGTRLPNSDVWTDEMNVSTVPVLEFAADRMPGVRVSYPLRENGEPDYYAMGDAAWAKYGTGATYAYSLTMEQTDEETQRTTTLLQQISDYANGAIQNFLLGRNELNETTFAAYQAEIERLGVAEYLQIKQSVYDKHYGLA